MVFVTLFGTSCRVAHKNRLGKQGPTREINLSDCRDVGWTEYSGRVLLGRLKDSDECICWSLQLVSVLSENHHRLISSGGCLEVVSHRCSYSYGRRHVVRNTNYINGINDWREDSQNRCTFSTYKRDLRNRGMLHTGINILYYSIQD